MKIKIISTLIISLLVTNLWAQDYFFTQNTTSQNFSPSFTGINKSGRINLGAKNNPQLDLYTTVFISYDHFFDKINSGFGLFFINDNCENKVGTREFAFNYTYEFNVNKKIKIRPALGISLRNDFVDFHYLVFGDQINFNGGVSPTTITVPPSPSIFNFDFTSSILIYGDRFWAGFTANHLAPVSNSMYYSDIYVKPKFSTFAGYKIFIEESVNDYFEKSVVLNASYITNTVYDYTDLRVYLNWDIITFALGMRNSIKEKYNTSSSSLISIIGINLKNLKIGYSYDWGIISKANYHEISLTYMILKNAKISESL
jgi:type IX secretion system PorP/SprF family membrane protein